MKSHREVWADILRILAMFFVVFIHVGDLPVSFTPFTIIDYSNFAIVKCCIALFFMISGAFLLGKEESYDTFFKKRFSKVIFPWLFWTIVYTLIQGITDCKHVHDIHEWKHVFEVTLFTRFWILPVLVGLYLATPLMRIYFKHASSKDNYYLLLLSFIFLSILPTLHDGATFPISFPGGLLAQVIMCGAFFVEGYILTTIPVKKIPLKYSTSLIAIGVLVTLGLSVEHIQEVDRFAYSIFSPGLVLTTTGIFLSLRSLNPFFEKFSARSKKILQVVSVASFGVYLTHEAVHAFFRYVLISSHQTLLLRTDLITNYIRTIIIFSLASLLIIGIQKIRYLKHIVP